MARSEWKEYKFCEIAEVIGGGTPSTSVPEYWNGDIPWLTPKDLTGYTKVYISNGERNITEYGLKNSSARLMPEGTVLLTSRAPIGYVAVAKNSICTNQGFKSLILKSDISSNLFIYYWLKANADYLQSLGTGTTFAEISGSVVKEINILLPPLPEQQAIASVLSSLDDKIDLLNRQNKTLEAMAETLFRQWFVEEAEEDWEEVTLAELIESANTGLDAIRRAPIVEKDTGVKCLRIQDISQQKNFNNWGNTDVSQKDFEKARLKSGDIIMARTCPPGIIYFAREDLNAVFNNGLAKIRPNKEKTYSLFLYYLFKTESFLDHIFGISDGTSVQLNMKLGELLSFKVTFPPKHIQDNYYPVFEGLDTKVFNNLSKIGTLQKLRDTLLPKLMNGEISVNTR